MNNGLEPLYPQDGGDVLDDTEAMKSAERFIEENPRATAEQREAIINAYKESIPSRTPAEARKRAVDVLVIGDCPVCLENMKRGDHNLTWLPCTHVFHADCVEDWLRSNRTCPNCRSSLD